MTRESDRTGSPGTAFDLVIGNPPYFQVRVTSELKERFGEVISGRANIFALFFQVGLELSESRWNARLRGAAFDEQWRLLRGAARAHRRRGSITDLTVLEGSGDFSKAQIRRPSCWSWRSRLRRVGGPKGGSKQRTSSSSTVSRMRISAAWSSLEPRRSLRDGFEGRQTCGRQGSRRLPALWSGISDVPISDGSRVLARCRWSGPATCAVEPSGPATVRSIADRERGARRPEARLHPQRTPADRPGAAGQPRGRRGRPGRAPDRSCPGWHGVPRREPRQCGPGRASVSDSADPSASRLSWKQLQAAVEATGTGDRARLLTGNTQLSATELTHLVPL